MKLIIRVANQNDLESIVKIDRDAYESIYAGPVGSSVIMSKRIEISSAWFLVAEVGGMVVGYLSLQPTMVGISTFKSWDKSTDFGTLEKTFDENGKYVYGVALTISKKFQGMDVSKKLFAAAAKKIISNNKKYIYFSGRMPGYHVLSAKMTAQEYYDKKVEKNGRLVSSDPQIRMYESYGFKKVRLVENGFIGDKESCNYSVIFQIKNPFYNLPFSMLWAFLVASMFRSKIISKLL